ncbi:hypothetical protein Tco_1230362, partial [Tanacetum coccineum]
ESAEAAFLEMKKLVSGLPTLTTPNKGETLMMYLVAANEAVSAGQKQTMLVDLCKGQKQTMLRWRNSLWP